MTRSRWMWLAAAVLAWGCSGGRRDLRPAGAGAAEAIHQGKQGAERVVETDLNHDGKPDVWSYYVKALNGDGKEIERLVRKELDINWDGRIDIRRTYDEKEQIQQEALDLDFDGRVDQTNFYEKGVLVRKERDLDYNGKTDEWVFYEKGKIVRKERDNNGDGRPDYWEYWENDAVDRIGEDLDGDGKVDRWSKGASSP